MYLISSRKQKQREHFSKSLNNIRNTLTHYKRGKLQTNTHTQTHILPSMKYSPKSLQIKSKITEEDNYKPIYILLSSMIYSPHNNIKMNSIIYKTTIHENQGQLIRVGVQHLKVNECHINMINLKLYIISNDAENHF